MLATETDPNKIAAFLIEKHDLTNDKWSHDERKRIKHLINSFVNELDIPELAELISQADQETAIVEEYVESLCRDADFVGPNPETKPLLQNMSRFALFRTIEANIAVAA